MLAPKARIYQKPKNALQSGRARTDQWLLSFERAEPKRHDPLTGWIGSGDTQTQVVLSFPSCEAAVEYAKAQGFDYEIAPSPVRRLKIQSYADNFR